MNIVLLDPRQTESDVWSITSSRQLEHLQTHVNVQVGDRLKVGIRAGKRYVTEVLAVSERAIQLRPIQEEAVPAKLPVTLIVAMPRPKVLRRLIMDSVTMGVEKITNALNPLWKMYCPCGLVLKSQLMWRIPTLK